MLSPASLADSAAFRQAALKSEVRRAYAVIAIIFLVAILFLRSRFVVEVDGRLIVVGVLWILGLLALQLGSLAFARWARIHDRPIPTWFLVATVIAEALIPTGIIFSHILTGTLPPYPALGAPPVLAYGLMITLTTLRLRPWLCILAGVVACAGYSGMLAYITLRLRAPEPVLPYISYINSAVLLVICSIAGAWVAHELRRHMEAALAEARTRAHFEQDLAVARSIQQALIPHTSPEIRGFEVAGWNRPADQTGGDYYDWQALPDGRWIITLADVSGHGIGPAMVTAACRAYVRASASQHRDLPSLASRINHLLAEDLPDGRFITMAGVLIDPDGSLALLSAGHGPIVLYASATATSRDIPPHGMPLAVLPDQSFDPALPVTMSTGDVLALITDGFVEWSREGPDGAREQFGLPRLKASLHRHAHLPPDALIQAITADVTAFAGSEPQQDDLTMVVIRRV